MSNETAKALVRKTFQNPFEKRQFHIFIKDLLNHFDDSQQACFTFQGNFIPEAYRQYIRAYERIGKYSDAEENKIDILIVYLQKERSLEMARSMQRNFIARYLNGGRGGDLKDAALVAFVAPNSEDWRFSLVKMEYKFTETAEGRVKVKEEFTPARRWSFLVGAHENSHTAQSRLAPIIADDEQNPSLKQLEEAFNIEKVTREFFEKYRELFVLVREELDAQVNANETIRAEFSAKNINPVDFAKKMLGQVVFLYFLQKKGWFGVARDKEWGAGSKNFLRELYEKKHGDYANFFNDVLEPLFYEALARERDEDFYSRFNCKIPFLNGGLFDPLNNYDWVHTDILLPNEVFSNTNKTKEGDVGNGILNIFNRYNFTVKEDEPLEKEVAIDPEMLGKVFENLLEVKDRKSKGTYYTPREIVHYMCQQSLINYLYTELNQNPITHERAGDGQFNLVGNEAKEGQLDITIKHTPEPVISKEDIETFIKYCEQANEHDAQVNTRGEETETYAFKMPTSILNNKKNIDARLGDIKICDPAVGSGAFLVGMMTEIIRARNYLSYQIGEQKRTRYNLKRCCIEQSLYGVDIDPGAVEIAKLRLWLSLIVEEENINQIKPLPNLDYKIVCGNSLQSVEKTLFNNSLFIEIEKLKAQLFDEVNSNNKNEYKGRIDKLILNITNNLKDFDFEIYFSEIFNRKKGFDIVIANPPYVSYGLRGGQKMSEVEKKFLRSKYPNSAEYKISLYSIFMDKAIQISKSEGGLQTLIVPDSFLLGRYFSKIRKFILSKNQIVFILLLPFGVFEATVGFSVIYLFQRKMEIDHTQLINARCVNTIGDVQKNQTINYSYCQEVFNKSKHNRFRLFFNPVSKNLIEKIENNTIDLASIIKFRSGLIGKKGKDSIISKHKIGEKWLRGIISGGEINRYLIRPEGNFIIFDKTQIHSGFECVDYSQEKLFLRQTGDSLICAYDNDGLLALNNVHVGNLINVKYSIKFIAALINSNLLNYYYRNISLETGRVMAQIDIETIDCLPIKNLEIEKQRDIIELVDQILMIAKDDNSTKIKQQQVNCLKEKIDQMVYKLYGLTEEEIKVVEGEK